MIPRSVDDIEMLPKIKAGIQVASLFADCTCDYIPYYVLRNGVKVQGGTLVRFTRKVDDEAAAI